MSALPPTSAAGSAGAVGVASSPAPRRISAPRWLDLRLVLGVVLVLVSVLIGATVVSGASDTTPVVTAGRDLAAGTTLRAQDLTVSQVQLSDDERGRYPRTLDAVVGKMLTRPVSRHELLPTAAVGTAPTRTVLTVPIAAGAAPQLRTGQRIQLWLSTPTCAFVVLLSDVTVQSVRSDDDGSFGSSGGGQNVVISVPPALAPRVVAAQSIQDASVRAGVITGSGGSSVPSSAPSPAGSAGGAAGGTKTPGLPGDLAACAGSGSR